MYLKSFKKFEKYIYPANAPKDFDEWVQKGSMFVEKFLPIIEKNCKPYLDDLMFYIEGLNLDIIWKKLQK